MSFNLEAATVVEWENNWFDYCFHLEQTNMSLHLDLYFILNEVFIWSILMLFWLSIPIRKLACMRSHYCQCYEVLILISDFS